MLEAKIGAISANGYGAAEHGCSLFMPAPISPVTLGNQMGKWAEPYDAAFLARWGARYAPSIIIEGEGHRWLSSAFVHGSWSQMIICLLNLAVIGAMVERRYGTPRFAALFILSTIGGNFLGAVADDVCVVTVGATAPNLGIIGLFLNDVAVSSVDVDGDGKITLAESKAWAARRRELILCFFVVLLQIAAALSELGLSSITTDLGGFLTGLMLSFLFLPGFLREKWEALVPFVGVAVASIIFIGLPALFYVSHSAQEPICKL